MDEQKKLLETILARTINELYNTEKPPDPKENKMTIEQLREQFEKELENLYDFSWNKKLKCYEKVATCDFWVAYLTCAQINNLIK